MTSKLTRISSFTLYLWLLTIPVFSGAENIIDSNLSIDIILSSHAKEHQAVFDAIKKHLESKKNDVIKITKHIADKYPIKNRNPNLVVTIGTVAARLQAKNKGNAPVISIFLPKYNYEAIWKGSNKTVSGIVIDQPVERFHELLKIMFSDGGKVGVFLGHRKIGYEEMNRLLKHSPLSLTIENVTGAITAKNITRLLKSSDIILIFPDHKTISPQRSKWLLYMAYRENKPVISYSSSFVRAGAIAAIYSTPESIGRQLAQRIILIAEKSGSLRKIISSLNDFYYPKYFVVETNAQVARHLGIILLNNKTLENKIASGIHVQEKGVVRDVH